MSDFTARKLRELRDAANISQSEAAKRMRISERKLRTLESGEREVTSDEIIEFAKLYKVDVREPSIHCIRRLGNMMTGTSWISNSSCIRQKWGNVRYSKGLTQFVHLFR